ncbi:MAG: hypothetical protein KKE05_03515, partial [Nanoarchaeota archaeon]|nr:hypothetical protein [Nanoarchaeota archaeon]
MPKKIQKNKSLFGNIVIIIVILVLLIGTIILFIRSLNNTPKTFEDEAKEFCKESNVESVSICNGQVIEVKSSLLGGGSTYHHK